MGYIVGGKEGVLQKGDVAFLPAGIPHTFWNANPDTMLRHKVGSCALSLSECETLHKMMFYTQQSLTLMHFTCIASTPFEAGVSDLHTKFMLQHTHHPCSLQD